MRRIKILQIITGLGIGGAEKVVYDLVRLSDKAKFDMTVISLSEREELLPQFREAEINTHILHIRNNGKGFLTKFLFLIKFVRRSRVDIIHAHMKHSLLVAIMLKGVMPRLKIVFTSHNQYIGSWFYRELIRTTKPFRDTDIIFSEEMKDSMYVNNGFPIPNGIDYSLYDKPHKATGRFTFILIGRLEWAKNHLFLIELAAKMHRDDFKIIIVGEGYLRAILEKKIVEKKLQNIVFLLGLRHDVPNLLSQSHCFLMPSLVEGMPIAILEAGAAGIPVISTPVGSISTLLKDGGGYLTELEGFSRTMEFVIDHYADAVKKASVLRARIRTEFGIELCVSRHESVYLSLIHK